MKQPNTSYKGIIELLRELNLISKDLTDSISCLSDGNGEQALSLINDTEVSFIEFQEVVRRMPFGATKLRDEVAVGRFPQPILSSTYEKKLYWRSDELNKFIDLRSRMVIPDNYFTPNQPSFKDQD